MADKWDQFTVTPQTTVPADKWASYAADPNAPPASKPNDQPDALSRYGSGLDDSTIGGLINASKDPVAALHSMLNEGIGLDDIKQMAEFIKQGKMKDAAALGLKYTAEQTIPGLKQTEAMAQPVAADIDAGNYAGAGGRLTGYAAQGLLAASGEGAGRFAKAAAPDVLTGAAKVAGGELAAKIPGMEWPVRIGVQYPGVRQIMSGVSKGAQAVKASLADRISAAIHPPEGFGIGSGDSTAPAARAATPPNEGAPAYQPPVAGTLPGQAPRPPGPPGFGLASGDSTAFTASPVPGQGTPNPAYRPPVSGTLPGQPVPQAPVASAPFRVAPAVSAPSGVNAVDEAAARLRQEFPQSSGEAQTMQVQPWHVAEMTEKQFRNLAKTDPQGAQRIQQIADNLNRMAAENARPPVTGAPPAQAAASPQTPAPAIPPNPMADWEAQHQALMNSAAEARSKWNPDSSTTSSQTRAQNVTAANAVAKGDRLGPVMAQRFRDAGVQAADLGKIPPGRVPIEDIAKGAIPGWENIVDDLKAQGLIDPKETTPNLSIPRIQFYLRQLEVQQPPKQ